MYSIDMTSNDVDKQIELLKHFPDIAVRHFRPALQTATTTLRAAILPNVPRKTGRAQDTFGSRVTGRSITGMKGQVGWYDKSDPFYPNVLEYGVEKPYEQNTFAPGLGKFVKIHPAMPARKFMEKGLQQSENVIEAQLAQANEAVVRDLAVP